MSLNGSKGGEGSQNGITPQGMDVWSGNQTLDGDLQMTGNSEETIAFTCAYAFVIVVGIIGNSLVVAVVKKNRSMHTTTNYLLANIAVADLITMTACVPFLAIKFFHHPKGKLGKAVCTIITKNNLASVALSVSVLTLCLLAVERYNALLKPMLHKLRMSKETALYAIAVTWLVAIIFSLPLLIHTDFNEKIHRCIYTFDGRIYWILVGTGIFGTLITICFCYFKVLRAIYHKQILGDNNSHVQDKLEPAKNKKKLVQLLMTLTIVFVIFFAPRLVFLFFSPLLEHQINVALFKRLSFFLVICNSCVNPIICAFQSTNYRNAFKKILVVQMGRNVAGRSSVRVAPEQPQIAVILRFLTKQDSQEQANRINASA